MMQQMPHPCEGLLRRWQGRRELANYYMTVLLRLSPDAPGALRRREELNEKIFAAQLCLRHAEDQLQSCYQEYGGEVHTGSQ
ncbi:MAG TPA: hypothetical protein VKB35_11010 [Ktedonobacteraceae bacterium]|nr:hypothetical protein [Ktedonobacteraceae bacterium]